MKIVKVSEPGWSAMGVYEKGILTFSPGYSGKWGNYQFEINNDCDECDYWLVCESAIRNESAKVPKGNLIFIPFEEVHVRNYGDGYLKQFDKIFTSRKDFKKHDVKFLHYGTFWHIRKSFDYLKQNVEVPKSKSISIISSSRVQRPGHIERFAFVNKLIGHFKERIDVFGRGFQFIDDKWDGLAPYRYSIAIENGSQDDYFTEKIIDCYLAHTFPVYFGCPNLVDYFEPTSFASIDIKDFNGAVKIIEQILEEDPYDEKLPFILQAKQQILEKYQFYPALTALLDQLPECGKRSRRFVESEKNVFYKNQIISNGRLALGNLRNWILKR